MKLWLFLIPWLWLIACSGVKPQRGTVLDTTAAGVVHALAGGTPTWTVANHWGLEEVAVYGHGHGPSLVDFVGVRALALDSTGRLYIAEASQIHVFDTLGALLRTIGRRGEGPGEYRWIAGLVALPERLLIVDYMANRYTLLDSAGHFLTAVPRPLSRWLVPWPGRQMESGLIVDYSIRVLQGIRYLVRYELDSALNLRERGTIALPVLPSNLFGPELTVDLTSEGALLGLPLTNEFVHISAVGDTLRRVRWLAPLPRSTARERKDAEEAAVSRVRATAAMAGAAAVPSPTYRATRDKPGFQRLWSGPSGTVWIERLGSPPRLAVFNAADEYLGDLQVPGRPLRMAHPIVARDRLIVVVEDSSGNEVVKVLRIVRPQPGS